MSRRREAAELARALTLSTQPNHHIPPSTTHPIYHFSSSETPSQTQDSRDLELRPFVLPGLDSMIASDKRMMDEEVLSADAPPVLNDDGGASRYTGSSGKGTATLPPNEIISPINSFNFSDQPFPTADSNINLLDITNTSCYPVPSPILAVSSSIYQYPATRTSVTETSYPPSHPLFSPTDVSIIPEVEPPTGESSSSPRPVTTYSRKSNTAADKATTTPRRVSKKRESLVLSPDTDDELDITSKGKRRAKQASSDSEAEEQVEDDRPQSYHPLEKLTIPKRSSKVEVVISTNKGGSRECLDTPIKRVQPVGQEKSGEKASPDPLDCLSTQHQNAVHSSPTARAVPLPSRSSMVPVVPTSSTSGGMKDIVRSTSKTKDTGDSRQATKSKTPISVPRKSARQAQAEAEKAEREKKEAEEKAERRRKRALEKEAMRLREEGGEAMDGRKREMLTATSSVDPSPKEILRQPTRSMTPTTAGRHGQIQQPVTESVVRFDISPKKVDTKGKKRVREDDDVVDGVLLGQHEIIEIRDQSDDEDFHPRASKKRKPKVTQSKAKQGKNAKKAKLPVRNDKAVEPEDKVDETDPILQSVVDKEGVDDVLTGDGTHPDVVNGDVIDVRAADLEEEVKDDDQEKGSTVGVSDIRSESSSPIKADSPMVQTVIRSPLKPIEQKVNIPVKKYSPNLFKIPSANSGPNTPTTDSKVKNYQWKAPRDDLTTVLSKFPGAKPTGMSRRLKIAPLHAKIGPPAKALPPIPMKPVRKKKGDSDEDEDEDEEDEEEEGEDGVMRKKIKGNKARGMEWFMVED